MATIPTPNAGIPQPTPADPSSANTWGTAQSTGTAIIDADLCATNTVPVGGAANVVLTFAFGTLDQTCAAHFILTGVLTGNINVLWPNGKQRVFSVKNSTTGAFSLSIGADNGAGIPAGTTQTLAQGNTAQFVSDGTNVTPRQSTSAPGIISVTQQIFTANGTYTPTPGMQFCKVQMVGGGASGDKAFSGSGGGGAGEYAEGVFTAAQIGASQVVTIGAGGAATGPNNGGTTSLGALLTALGGSTPGGSPLGGLGGTGGAGTGLHSPGGDGANGIQANGAADVYGGQGGASYFGGGGRGGGFSGVAANSGKAYGSGGGGSDSSGAIQGAGKAGVIVITEFQ